MLKVLVPLAVLLSGTAATAAGIGPEIAYVIAGNGDAVYLVNPDGSGKRLLYKGARKTRIFALDMKPGGGELAFEETPCCSSGGTTLKVLRYDDAGALLETKPLATCRILSLDYHPSGSDLLVHDSCGTRRLDTQTMAATPLSILPGTNKAAWRNATELVYNRSTAAASEMFIAPLSDAANASVVGTTALAQSMDVSTAGDRVLIDPVDFGSLNMFDLSTGADQSNWQIGHNGHFSPDDTRVLYATGYDVRGQYLMIRNTNGSGSPFRLASKGPFGPIDWRN